jgi:hypothetical protein
MTPLARDGPKLRPELWLLARIIGKALCPGSLTVVILSGSHVAHEVLSEPTTSRPF